MKIENEINTYADNTTRSTIVQETIEQNTENNQGTIKNNNEEVISDIVKSYMKNNEKEH